MAINWYPLPNVNDCLEFGIEWNNSQSDGYVSIAPRIYRWDKYTTDNYGGSWGETITEPNGSTGSWSGLTYPKGKGTREIDSFNTRTYERKHSAYNITYVMSWQQTGTWYSDSFHYTSDGSHTWTLTVPAKPSYTASYNANGGSGAPSNGTKWYNEDYTLSSTTPTRSGYTFAGWATSANGSAQYQAGGVYSSNQAVTFYAVWNVNAPSVAPTIGTNTRNSDNSNTITWTYTSTTPPVATFGIQRSTNGGEWVQIVSVQGSGSGSYIDTTTAPNNYYSYRLRAGNAGGAGPWSNASNTTYNTPSTPTNLEAVFNASLQVVLTWTQTGNTENGVKVEVSADQQTWTTVTTASGTNVSTYTDTNPPAGTAYYRVSNVYTSGGTTLASEPSNVAQVLTLAKPNPPTLVNPSNGAVLDMPSSVVLTWKHNPTDGTPQQYAFLEITVGSGVSTVTVTGAAQTYTLNTSSVAANTAVSWKVSTKGTYATASDYSATSTFYIKKAPSVTITQPTASDGGSITDVPVQVAFTYSDSSGSFQNATIAVTNSAGRVLYSNANPTWTTSGSTYSTTIPTSDFLPTNNSSYTLTLVASSDSGLSTTVARIFATDYDEPNPPEVSYTIDSDACSITLNVSEGTGESEVETVSVGLFRVTADGELAIAAEMASGDSVTDYLPPLDQTIYYRAVAYTVNGLTSQTLVPVNIDSDGKAYFNWGAGNTEYAAFNMDLTWKTSADHKRALYEVAGLADPVVRTTSRRTRTLSASGTVWWDDDAQLEALQDVPGRVWFREPRGHVVPVVVKVDLTYPKGQPTTSASISMTQVAKESGE